MLLSLLQNKKYPSADVKSKMIKNKLRRTNGVKLKYFFLGIYKAVNFVRKMLINLYVLYSLELNIKNTKLECLPNDK